MLDRRTAAIAVMVTFSAGIVPLKSVFDESGRAASAPLWAAESAGDPVGGDVATEPYALAASEPALRPAPPPGNPVPSWRDALREDTEARLEPRLIPKSRWIELNRKAAAIPKPRGYRVQPGDTLSELAVAWKVTVADITRANPGVSAPRIRSGSLLAIPNRATVDADWLARHLAAVNKRRPPRREFAWPVRGRISGRFGPRAGEGTFHKGVDLAAPVGTPIHVARDGRVVFAGRAAGYGKLVIVQHAGGNTTYYAHASRLLARAGTRVSAGQVIARVGNTGVSTGPHLHFEIRRGMQPLDPLPRMFQ